MTSEEVLSLKRVIVSTSAYYGRQLLDEAVLLFVEDLKDIPFLAILSAITQYRRDPKNRAMFLPAQIREIACPTESLEDIVREIPELIFNSMRRCGWANPQAAKERMGELAWAVVQNMGGLQHICEITMDRDITTLRPQIREIARSLYNRTRAGTAGTLPTLPGIPHAIE